MDEPTKKVTIIDETVELNEEKEDYTKINPSAGLVTNGTSVNHIRVSMIFLSSFFFRLGLSDFKGYLTL